jgi:hypothetical protein
MFQNDAAIGDGDLGCPATKPSSDKIASSCYAEEARNERQKPLRVLVLSDDQTCHCTTNEQN